MESGLVFNIQRFSLQDGPGIRTTVFLKGCPASCPWCHNPESQSDDPEIVLREERCIRCGECGLVCPLNEERGRSRAGEGGEKCIRCGACVEACPAEARELAGRSMTVTEVLDELLADRIFYDESGGGVTFSGGEPLAQYPFLLALLEGCREQGLRTAVDTCGHAPTEQLLRIAPLAGIFLFDLKLMDDQRHLEVIGITNSLILENLRVLASRHREIHVRVPVIPGVNDDERNIEELARFTASLEGVRRIDLLPYHAIGAAKFRRLGRTYEMGEITPPSRERLEELAGRMQAHGIAENRVGWIV